MVRRGLETSHQSDKVSNAVSTLEQLLRFFYFQQLGIIKPRYICIAFILP